MNPYIPSSDSERLEMLQAIGKNKWEDLITAIPTSLRLQKDLDLPKGLSEAEVFKHLKALARRNQGTDELTCFMGAGAYDSLIPVAVKSLTSRSEFYTAYTPYQPEISQGTLSCIFEFQTMIAELTGMDCANASMYDGATACAEAAIMAGTITRHKKLLVSSGTHPETLEVLKTYLPLQNMELVIVPTRDGEVDLTALEQFMTEPFAGVLIQSPNIYGCIETKAETIAKMAHDKKSLMIMSVLDAHALALFKTPGEIGADIAVGEGMSFGNGLNFGGPYLGFMATTNKYVRKLPGRIVGETVDADGKRAYVLTLQAREQHIRREKATSNICSNQGLNALTATIYLSLLGKEGLKEAALDSAVKARALQTALIENGIEVPLSAPFYREFPIVLTKPYETVMAELLKKGILGGYHLKNVSEADEHMMLICTTEKRTYEEMDHFVRTLKSILEVA